MHSTITHCACPSRREISKLAQYRTLHRLWLWLLLVSFAAAQQVNTATPPVRTLSIFEEIQNPQERRIFKELWETEDPRQARQRAIDFVARYPRTVLLREAYEVAAR